MKGILFTETMFLAVVKGRKTQTRRIFRIHKDDIDENGITDWYNRMPHIHWEKNDYGFYYDTNEGETIKVLPRYQPGEIVYLKEPYFININEFEPCSEQEIVYKYADFKFSNRDKWKWNNKLFMPAKYARFFIKIKNVRVEMLQNITHDDAIAEGIKNMVVMDENFDEPVQGFQNYIGNHYFVTGDNQFSPAQRSFRSLWVKINGENSWDKNPWVFAYTFELTSNPLKS